ncbi:MAG: sulfotransferase [Bacteroidia bacterium]|nr:sulfotransferase [Bacteroidia bacterium]
MKPSFFIVGAPKAGTTALHAYLEKHPQVCMSRDKEPNFFSWQEIEAQQLYYKKENARTEEHYLALFHPSAQTKICGEASVSYLFYEKVPERIKKYNPDARIIMALRNPVHRAFSHYQMDYSLGLVHEDFETIFRNGREHPKTGAYFQQYFLLSDYAPQVERYLRCFPKEQIHVLLQDDLVKHPEATLKKLCDFLGIDRALASPVLEQHNVTGAGKNRMIRTLYKYQFVRKTLALLTGEKMRNKIKGLLFSKSHLPVLQPSFAAELRTYYQPGLERLQTLIGLPVELLSGR